MMEPRNKDFLLHPLLLYSVAFPRFSNPFHLQFQRHLTNHISAHILRADAATAAL